MDRRLEDRVMQLCAKALATEEHTELYATLEELKAAIHEHCERVRKLAIYPIAPERRSFPRNDL
jgi:hypothetical protein